MDDEHFAEEMSDERLAEITARLAEPPPFVALTGTKRGRTPVASYISVLRSDQIDLVSEIERFKAELEAERRPLMAPMPRLARETSRPRIHPHAFCTPDPASAVVSWLMTTRHLEQLPSLEEFVCRPRG
jgi:hypothetical protein